MLVAGDSVVVMVGVVDVVVTGVREERVIGGNGL